MLCDKCYKNCLTSIKKNSRPKENGFCQDYQKIRGIILNKPKTS